MRELREFREAHAGFQEAGIALAGVSTDTIESHRRWAERLRISYPLLSDSKRAAGDALGLVRRFGIGGWTIDLFRRATLLVDVRGTIAAGWTQVKIRGHATEVLAAARGLGRDGPSRLSAAAPSPPSG